MHGRGSKHNGGGWFQRAHGRGSRYDAGGGYKGCTGEAAGLMQEVVPEEAWERAAGMMKEGVLDTIVRFCALQEPQELG